MVDEQTAGGVDVVRLQCYVSHIPDALYMVEDNAPHHTPFAPSSTVDVVAAAIPGNFPSYHVYQSAVLTFARLIKLFPIQIFIG